MAFDLSVFFTYVGVIVLIFVFGKLFLVPLKVILRWTFNSVLGGLFLLGLNYFGQSIDISIPLNVLNACIVGILGLPGVIMLLLLTR
ncbi:MAG: pro-sigmaK processing inhibitor BofA family protein [Firmicutes bacterium]|nr:pro-sigmaK processing inhibitor BofA family protein [Bacillota bacterium]